MSANPRSPFVRHRRSGFALVLMTASGFAGLGYQIVWTRQVAPWAGHDAAAVLAVITAFFGGLAFGAAIFGDAIERSRRPARWYVACEASIGAWALLLALLMPRVGEVLMQLIGAESPPLRAWAIVFAGTFLAFLPATAAMGATIPALELAMVDARTGPRSLAAQYACNTFGAVIGVLATTFWTIPAHGLVWTAALCSTMNFACAAGAWLVLPRAISTTPAVAAGGGRSARGLLARLWATGLLGIGYEVVVVRVLGQVAEDTVYTFALLLAVYLAGTTIGAAIHRHTVRAATNTVPHVDRLAVLLAAACLAGTAVLYRAEAIRDFLLGLLPDGIAYALTTEATLALVAFAGPTIVMGMLFTSLCDLARSNDCSFGRAIGVNTFGAACAPCVFGVFLIPAAGLKTALVLIVGGYLATVVPRIGRSAVCGSMFAGIAAAAVAWVLFAPPLAFVDVPHGGTGVFYRDGVTASVSIVEDMEGIARLRIDNRQQEGTSATAFVDGRQALLPLLLHRAPRQVLFLGLGTGVTANTAASVPGVEVDAVELLPEVIEASHRFTDPPAGATRNPHLHVIAADARRYVRATDASYDVIVADNFHPARAGSGALYTVEHFEAIRARLRSDGVFCQWLPLHQLDRRTLRSIVATFVEVFPDGFAILANNSLDTPVVGLVARRDSLRIDADVVRERIDSFSMPSLRAFGIDDVFSVLGSAVAGPASLASFANGVALNRDDRPVVAYQAPRAIYAPDDSPRERLTAWLREVSVGGDEVVDTTRDRQLAIRLAAYRQARDRFIEVGRNVQPSWDVNDMLAQVRAPLLSVLKISPDFRPAYDPLLRMAAALSQRDSEAASGLLKELVGVQPDRREAGDLLARLTTPAVPAGR